MYYKVSHSSICLNSLLIFLTSLLRNSQSVIVFERPNDTHVTLTELLTLAQSKDFASEYNSFYYTGGMIVYQDKYVILMCMNLF